MPEPKHYPNEEDPCRDRGAENEKCDKYDSYVNRDKSEDAFEGGSSEYPQFRLNNDGYGDDHENNWGEGLEDQAILKKN